MLMKELKVWKNNTAHSLLKLPDNQLKRIESIQALMRVMIKYKTHLLSIQLFYFRIIKLRTQRRGGDRRRGLQRRYQQRRDNNKRLDREPRRRDNRETEGR